MAGPGGFAASLRSRAHGPSRFGRNRSRTFVEAGARTLASARRRRPRGGQNRHSRWHCPRMAYGALRSTPLRSPRAGLGAVWMGGRSGDPPTSTPTNLCASQRPRLGRRHGNSLRSRGEDRPHHDGRALPARGPQRSRPGNCRHVNRSVRRLRARRRRPRRRLVRRRRHVLRWLRPEGGRSRPAERVGRGRCGAPHRRGPGGR